MEGHRTVESETAYDTLRLHVRFIHWNKKEIAWQVLWQRSGSDNGDMLQKVWLDNDSVRGSCGVKPSNNLQTSASQAGLWKEEEYTKYADSNRHTLCYLHRLFHERGQQGPNAVLRCTHLSIQRVHNLAYFLECVDSSTVRVLRWLKQVNSTGPVR